MQSQSCVAALLVCIVMHSACAEHDRECYDTDNPKTYTGHTAVTKTGVPCQMWSSQYPHQHTLGDSADDFTDGEFPSNYCRSTVDDSELVTWCYTEDVYVRWQYCDVPKCTCTGDFVTYGSSCYALVNKSATWEVAQTDCESLGGFLAEVKASDQNDFFFGLTGSTDGVWLGAVDDISDGGWVWQACREAMSYSNWAINEPNPDMTQPGCLLMNGNGMWQEEGCEDGYSYICQKNINELSNGRVNTLVNVVDALQKGLEDMTNTVQEFTQKQDELKQNLLEARHIESGRFQCGNFKSWTADLVQTQEQNFTKEYPAPPTVHVSLVTLDTNVNKRRLGFTFAVNATSTTGFNVTCKIIMGRHDSKLWKLDLAWISIPYECDTGFIFEDGTCVAATMEAYYGNWTMDLARTQNMEQYLKASGFPDALEKEFSEYQWQKNYSSQDGKLVVHVKVTNRPALPEKTYIFTLDQEMEVEGLHGESYLMTMSWDGARFTKRCRSVPGAPRTFEFKMVMELKGDEMIQSSTINGVTMTQVYVRVTS